MKEELAHAYYSRKTAVIGIKVCITNDADQELMTSATCADKKHMITDCAMNFETIPTRLEAATVTIFACFGVKNCQEFLEFGTRKTCCHCKQVIILQQNYFNFFICVIMTQYEPLLMAKLELWVCDLVKSQTQLIKQEI